MEIERYDDEKVIDSESAKVLNLAYKSMVKALEEANKSQKTATLNRNIIRVPPTIIRPDPMLSQILFEVREIRRLLEISRRIRLS